MVIIQVSSLKFFREIYQIILILNVESQIQYAEVELSIKNFH